MRRPDQGSQAEERVVQHDAQEVACATDSRVHTRAALHVQHALLLAVHTSRYTHAASALRQH